MIINLVVIAYLALTFRILLVGSERIFLKFLDEYDPIVIGSLFFLLASAFLLPMLFFIDSDEFPTDLSSYKFVMMSSIVYTFGFYAYVYAMSLEDASLIAPLYNSSLLWLLLLGYFFLDEEITTFRVIGGIIMFCGVFFLYPGSINEKILRIRSSKASIIMIIGSLFLAIGRTIDTAGINSSSDPLNNRIYAFLINFITGSLMFLVVLIKGKSSEIKIVFSEKPRKLMLAGFTNGWGYLMLLFALTKIDVTIAVPATLLSIFVTAFLAKKLLNEKAEERILGMVVMIIGSFLLFF